VPSTSRYTGWSRLSSDEFERSQRQNAEERRAFSKRWAEYVRTHDDAEWPRQQNTLIDSQLETANEMARRGDTDPIAFFDARAGHRTDPDEESRRTEAGSRVRGSADSNYQNASSSQTRQISYLLISA
jgi:hypothetical protein